MSGHSKWANIKHRKERVDAKKGKVFSQLSKLISAAVKAGSQSGLEKAIAQAKAANMPKVNIEKAIQSSKSSTNLEQAIYEAVGSFGTGFLIEISTDNKNRVLSELKSVLNNYNAKLGAVGWMFDNKQPKYPITLENNQKSQIQKLLQDLESLDDVERIYSNVLLLNNS